MVSIEVIDTGIISHRIPERSRVIFQNYADLKGCHDPYSGSVHTFPSHPHGL
jgi:hypothetical protein